MSSRFYALMFVALTGILVMVSPPDEALMVAQAQTKQDRQTEALRIGLTYYFLGDFKKVQESFLQAIELAKEIGDQEMEERTTALLNYLLQKMRKSERTSINIPPEAEAHRLSFQASVLIQSSQFEAALQSLQQALTIYRAIKDRYQLQALEIRREIKDRLGEAAGLGNLGLAYDSLGKYDKAIEFHLQSLAIDREIKDRLGELRSLGSLGSAYYSLGKYDKAIEFQLQSLEIAREIKDRLGEGNALGNLGLAYDSLDNYDKAITFSLHSLAIAREIKNRDGEKSSLNNLGVAFKNLNQPELAILFYKQSVNVIESIRQDIRKLSKDEQKSYLSTVEVTYRNLADLLLKQDRILEAQQVLDLLKVEELNDYLRTPTRSSQTEQGTELRTQEKTFIALALELDELQKRKLANNITTSEQERLNQLVQSEREQNKQFTAFLNSPTVQKLVDELRRTEEQQNIDTKNLRNLRTDILAQHPNTVLLYPLILEDRLELILITAKTPPIRRTINIKREKLNQEIVDFLTKLRDPSSQDIKVPAQQLYTW
ncbi:MAG: tetratricopeptide repeat protein, partial [Pseudanabaena sp.]